jgi:methylated-DNA-[protein]-cysteine S-methyltransferase
LVGSARSAYTLLDSPLGMVGVAWKGSLLLAIRLPLASAVATAEALGACTGGLEPGSPPPEVAGSLVQIRRYLAGEEVDLGALPVDLGGVTAFRRRAYEAARALGRGEVIGYGALAARLGSPGAARAVGGAMANNPLPIVVPCHRVVGANGAPGGFSSSRGLEHKAALLALEGYTLELRGRGGAAGPDPAQQTLL